MIKPDDLPPGVVEEAAKAAYYHAQDPDDPPIPWEGRTPGIRAKLLAEHRVALAAALNAWPEMEERQEYLFGYLHGSSLILPLKDGKHD